MKLSDAGESRLRGYLYMFDRALRASAISSDIAGDAVREVESHIRERVAELEGASNEREALEAILTHIGAPGRVAHAYSLELVMEEASSTGALAAMGRALVRTASTGIAGFFGAIGLFVGYSLGMACVALAVLKPIFPSNIGLWTRDGLPRTFGALFPPPTDMELAGGYWIIPISLVVGFGILFLTHAGARRWIGWMKHRVRRPFATTR